MLTYKYPLILQQNTAATVMITCKKKPWISLSKAPLEHIIIFHTFQFFLIDQVIHPFHLSLTFRKTDV